MKKIIPVATAIGIIAYVMSCTKATSGYYSCSGPSAASDSTILLLYATRHGMDAVADTSWLYYQIIDTGTGTNPTGRSKVTFTYVGKFLNDSYFDSTSAPQTFELDSLIEGWQYGLPKIRNGGRIKLLVPSALAFGCRGNGSIQPNTPLYFDVRLIGVAN
ncbi:MAG: FKBP-type peptidyl-prolyl cis-trans isomerase [Bacteroidetes bacterium]|nr:FKBP-type peptidyl-prolyl cis-trans isomerase [Bacteroidota bacterium]MBS1973124.1 FKBP-type peptidyl-prolyl cis-trans isomerase [Bacteroidota bacterium]